MGNTFDTFVVVMRSKVHANATRAHLAVVEGPLCTNFIMAVHTGAILANERTLYWAKTF